MKKDDRGVISLLKAYANAEQQIASAAKRKNLTVKEYQRNLNATVKRSLSMLDERARRFSEHDLTQGFSEGQSKVQGHVPQEHETISVKQAATILKQAGFRYDPKGFGYDTYVELHSATEAAGNGFLRRVNRTIDKLTKEGKDTVYNVSEAVKKDIEEQGLLNVEYSNGRKVSVSSYAAMAARSARIESANIGAFGRALENGTDYVRCTEIYPTCEICAKYQGKIYCISGRDKRFPALFETALRKGYAIMHPNCRHEFIPVWLETMSGKELKREIERSKISRKADTRSEKERDAYAAWQAENRQMYSEQAYFEQAKQRLGRAMPYQDIGAFRRAYRSKKNTFAYKRSHNLIRDYHTYIDYKQTLKDDPDFPKTLAKFQEIKYNNNEVPYQILKREKNTISSIKRKGWSESFTEKSVNTYYEFKAKNIEFTDHGVARLVQRGFDKEIIEDICKNYPFNFKQDDGKIVKFYNEIAIIYSIQTGEVVSVIHRGKPKKEWKNV